MSVNINADTTNGLVLTSDTSGEIKLQSAGADIATVSSTGITMAAGKTLPASALSGSVPAANMPSGSILQTVSAIKTNTASGASGDWRDTGITASITPSSTSSKILIMTNISGGRATSNTWLRIMRDSTPIGLGDSAGNSQLQATFGNLFNYTDGNIAKTHSYQIVDSPSSTSAITYKVQGRCNSGTFYINQTENNQNTVDQARLSSSIILMEVAG